MPDALPNSHVNRVKRQHRSATSKWRPREQAKRRVGRIHLPRMRREGVDRAVEEGLLGARVVEVLVDLREALRVAAVAAAVAGPVAS